FVTASYEVSIRTEDHRQRIDEGTRLIHPALKYPIDSVRAELVEAPSRVPFDKLRANVILGRVNNALGLDQQASGQGRVLRRDRESPAQAEIGQGDGVIADEFLVGVPGLAAGVTLIDF